MTPGAWILLASVLLALVIVAWRAYADGRFRGTHRVRGVAGGGPVAPTPGAGGADPQADPGTDRHPDGQDPQQEPLLPTEQRGERATLLQFSSAFCAPCRATRRVLADVATTVPGVVHVEIDAEEHLDLVRRVGVLRTPTTLVLDASGHEVTRAAGAPRPEQVMAALARVEA